ncbi:MAG: DNA polymerase III subunit alpha [Dermatophilaceae bacterium]
MEAFVHLHTASGYSMQYGASTPADLVARAAELGQPALALTDRDGLYGAIRFVQACTEATVAPILGVDLAVCHPDGATRQGRPPGRPARTPVRGGALVDPRLPRVTVLARGMKGGVAPGLGWARLCRLVTRTHLSGERGAPVTTPDLVAELARCAPEEPSPLVVLLGPDSDVGRAVLARRRAEAGVALARWQALLPHGSLVLEAVCHGGPEGTPMSLGHAARMMALGRDTGIPVVLSAAVRHTDPKDAATVDVLDAARRLVALDVRHLDRVTTAGHLAASPAMYAVACDVAAASGPGVSGGTAMAREAAQALLAQTVALADECVLDPAIDLGIGAVHLPEPTAIGLRLDEDPQRVLAQRCRDALPSRYPGVSGGELDRVTARLEEELAVIDALGYPTYFLTVATVTDLIRQMRVRVAARGSGAGSLVNYLLGISGVDPIRCDLLMERFCTTLRAQLPDIDIDVESARRTEIYEKILARFGGERVTCVSMMDSYRVRHAIRDVGAALGLPPAEVDAMAKAFPHVSARYARSAIADLPELRVSGLGSARYELMFDLVERLDGLPRHIAVHPCGVILSNSGLLDRTPVEASWVGFPMSQFDKDDVEVLGLLKLDVLGIRMQSAMAHAVDEVARVDGVHVDLDDQRQVPLDDEATFRLIRTTHTLGCFQIESPGQRELIGKFGPERFEDLVIDISLFRPGPVKSDMIVPFLNARQGWQDADYLHPTLVKALAETEGVVVFHEQILLIVAETTGVSLAEADEVRRALGSVKGQAEVEAWWRPAALARGYSRADADRIWAVLAAFASFGFCKAHAAAFALPTYQSAWLKTHHPAAFLAGVLTHDPGMYPKRLILDDARSLGIEILGLDVNASKPWYAVERVDGQHPYPLTWEAGGAGSSGGYHPPELRSGSRQTPHAPSATDPARSADHHPPELRSGSRQTPHAPSGVIGRRRHRGSDLPDARGYGIRIALADVKGITEPETARIVAGAPYATLADFWRRAHVSRPVVERLVLAGGFDSVYGLGVGGPTGSRDKVTRRDLLLHVAELDRWSRSAGSGAGGARWSRRPATMSATGLGGASSGAPVTDQAALAAAHPRAQDPVLAQQPGVPSGPGSIRDVDVTLSSMQATDVDVAVLAAAQTQATAPARVADRHTQLTLDLGDAPALTNGSGLPELTRTERVRAELEILGLDASAHVVDVYGPMLDALGVVRARRLLDARSRSEVWVAGVKVATQTPPVRSGRRVVFLTLDDGTGPVDATFFEDVQGPYAATVFHSWMLLVRGIVRRTGRRGLSVRATGAWELSRLWEAWSAAGGSGPDAQAALWAALAAADSDAVDLAAAAVAAFAEQYAGAPGDGSARSTDPPGRSRAGGMGGSGHGPTPGRRVLVHASGFRQSPYADVRPAGEDVRAARALAAEEPPGQPPRKLWHASPGSSGH